MTDKVTIASFFFQLSEDSCKLLTSKDLRGPGRRKSLTASDLGKFSILASREPLGLNKVFCHLNRQKIR
jgi:hypothetical protein